MLEGKNAVHSRCHFHTQRENVENAATRTNGSLPILEGVPRKTQPRLKIQPGGILHKWTSQKRYRGRILQYAKIREFTIYLADDAGRLVTQPPIHRQIGTDVHIVLEVSSKNILSYSAGRHGTWAIGLK